MKKKLMSLAVAGFLIAAASGCTPTDVAIAHFPANQRGNAQCVVRYESGGDPGAVSPGGGNHGLFQINTVHKGTFRQVTGKNFYPGVYDADANGKFAAWLWRQQGWRPWTAARKCGLV